MGRFKRGENEGLKGLPALVIRIFPYAGFQFYSNDKYRIQWKKYGYQTVRIKGIPAKSRQTHRRLK